MNRLKLQLIYEPPYQNFNSVKIHIIRKKKPINIISIYVNVFEQN